MTDWTTLPLAGAGRSLVEASAGTGKTWTIAVLYLRLLLEEGLSPRRIVVSTFTNAAAAELGERLRGKLLWALGEASAHRAGHHAGDSTAADSLWLRGRWRSDTGLRDHDVHRLQAALTELDSAPIATLHALCSRVLVDHPFAAGTLFRGRSVIDARTLEAALADDLWRVIAQGDEGDELVCLARAAGVGRKLLGKYVPVLLQPNVTASPRPPEAIIERIGSVVGEVSVWAAELQSVVSQPGLLRAGGKLEKAWKALAEALGGGQEALADALTDARDVLLEADALRGVNNAGKQNPAVLKLASDSVRLAQAMSPLELDLAGSIPLRRFLDAAQRWLREAMQARLDAANQSTFDQLLLSVRNALQAQGSERALADALFAAWPVALVDEFQDTDPVQFAILDEIYRDSIGAPRGRLVMIGDPKQAIYRFRGGDVQAYERAKAAVAAPDRLSLATNHRSSRSYVEAVNQFYAVTGDRIGPTGSDTGIRYLTVQPSARRDGSPLRSASAKQLVERPLVLHELVSDDGASDLETLALRACAGQVAQALSSRGYLIGGQGLKPGDIAVLLPNHSQIARLALLLKARGVPCVVNSQKSVFESETARDLRVLLHAALHAEDPRALHAALATRLCGLGLGELQALRRDAAALDRHASRFHLLREFLQERGPMAVVADLLETHAARWMQSVAGERILTDLRHLGELLQEAWVDLGGGERLATWFASQMDNAVEDADAADARALRLESDAERVQLMTLHASKGLEFGVVFLPLMWKHTRPKPARDGAQLLTADDGSVKHLVEGPARSWVQEQEYEERFRILYVALTRAIHACHVFVLAAGDGAAPRIAKARAAPQVPINALDLERLKDAVAGGGGRIAFEAGWSGYPGLRWSEGSIRSGRREARPLPSASTGPLPMRHSFTALSGGRRQRTAEEDGAADDEALAERDVVSATVDANDPVDVPARASTFHSELDVLSGLAGADFGNAVHALFEHRVAGQPIEAPAVLAALLEHGVRPRGAQLESLVEPLAGRLNAVLETRLGGAGGPRLSEIKAEDMRAEMEFNYLLDGVPLRALREACEQNGEPGMVPLREQTLAGLMNGKIDLLFCHAGRVHVLDYKSNQLAAGPRGCLEDYAPAALEARMASTGYRFQALLYTVAVERYLRERYGDAYRRDVHLGDCWYLFVRAVGLQCSDGTPCGVWRHRFADGLLDAVQGVLRTWGEGAA